MLQVKLFSINEDGGFYTSDTYDVDYISLVNSDTYGPPPLIAPEGSRAPTAQMDEEVLYINTALVPAFHVKRYD